jgi:hypothetical protein
LFGNGKLGIRVSGGSRFLHIISRIVRDGGSAVRKAEGGSGGRWTAERSETTGAKRR